MTLAIRENSSLSSYTTLKTGGGASFIVPIISIEDLKAAVTFARAKGLPFFVLGGGSNILASDAGYAGVVLHMQIGGRSYDTQRESGYVHATYGAGEILDEVIAETVKNGLWGIENLSHIPGTVGATPVQNVGAYGVEVGELITAVTAYDTQDERMVTLTADECQFSYRDSVFKHSGDRYIITHVTFRLSVAPAPRIAYADLATRLDNNEITQAGIRETIIAVRSRKFPDWNRAGTAGSFFKNPIITQAAYDALAAEHAGIPVYDAPHGMKKVSLGYILDKVCGLKGYRIGNVRLYEEQALVLVADGTATSTEIDTFAKKIADIVFQKTNIHIEREVTQL